MNLTSVKIILVIKNNCHSKTRPVRQELFKFVNGSELILPVSGITEMAVAGHKAGLEIAQPAVAALENKGLLGCHPKLFKKTDDTEGMLNTEEC